MEETKKQWETCEKCGRPYNVGRGCICEDEYFEEDDIEEFEMEDKVK